MAAGAAQGKHFAVSPDGRLLAYIGQDRTLNLRSFDSLESSHFPQLGTMSTPFFSPDSQWIGFFSAGSNELKKIAVAGGPPMTLSQTPGTPRGATWTSDGRIVFGVSGSSSGLWTVSSNGGKPVETIKPEPGSTVGASVVRHSRQARLQAECRPEAHCVVHTRSVYTAHRRCVQQGGTAVQRPNALKSALVVGRCGWRLLGCSCGYEVRWRAYAREAAHAVFAVPPPEREQHPRLRLEASGLRCPTSAAYSPGLRVRPPKRAA